MAEPATLERETEEAVRADLEAYLRARVAAGLEVDLIGRFGDGHSGVTYEVALAAGAPVDRAILRLSPPGVRIAGPVDIGRQGRIMDALDRAGLPVPCVIACDTEPVIDGRSFALVDFVPGEPWEAAAARRSHRHVALQAIATLHRIRALGPAAGGLDEAPRAPADELQRWAPMLSRCPAGLAEAATPLVEALAAATPPPSRPGLVHGDFHYGNLLFANGQVVATVDWEIAHLGEPLLDLGCLAVATMRGRYEPEPNPTGSVQVGVAELVEAYGAGAEEAAWFIALTALKYAAIIGYNLELHRSGKRFDPIYTELQRTMTGLVDDGLLVLRDGVDGV